MHFEKEEENHLSCRIQRWTESMGMTSLSQNKAKIANNKQHQ